MICLSVQLFFYSVDLFLVLACNSIEKMKLYDQKFSIGVIALEIKRDYYLNKLVAKKHLQKSCVTQLKEYLSDYRCLR